MILYFKDSLGCTDNNSIELINNYLYHYVTVITMCFMFHQRLLRCRQQSTKQGKPTSSYSLRLATSANVTVLAVDDRHVAFCEYNGSVARIICVAVATLENEKLLERASDNDLLLCRKSTSNKTCYRQ